jgi:hypothetical protein
MKEVNATKTGSVTDSGMTNDVLSISIGSHHDQQWLLDFGATNHMCLHRHWFVAYQSIYDGMVYMGNDISCKVVGIGSIRIKMFDGTFKILTDMRHLPKLRKNLISLEVLDTGGYVSIVVMFPSHYARNITSCMNFKLFLVVAFRQTLFLL